MRDPKNQPRAKEEKGEELLTGLRLAPAAAAAPSGAGPASRSSGTPPAVPRLGAVRRGSGAAPRSPVPVQMLLTALVSYSTSFCTELIMGAAAAAAGMTAPGARALSRPQSAKAARRQGAARQRLKGSRAPAAGEAQDRAESGNRPRAPGGGRGQAEAAAPARRRRTASGGTGGGQQPPATARLWPRSRRSPQPLLLLPALLAAGSAPGSVPKPRSLPTPPCCLPVPRGASLRGGREFAPASSSRGGGRRAPGWCSAVARVTGIHERAAGSLCALAKFPYCRASPSVSLPAPRSCPSGSPAEGSVRVGALEGCGGR